MSSWWLRDLSVQRGLSTWPQGWQRRCRSRSRGHPPAYGTIHALPVVEFGPGGAGLIAWRNGAGIQTIWNPAPFG
jgi:hypothetical protein